MPRLSRTTLLLLSVLVGSGLGWLSLRTRSAPASGPVVASSVPARASGLPVDPPAAEAIEGPRTPTRLLPAAPPTEAGHVGRPKPAVRPLAPGLVQQSDLRRRVGEAAGLARRARSGDAEAAAEVSRRLATEPDPRVRQALATGELPDLGRQSRRVPPVLPEAMQAAEAGEVQAYWLSPRHPDDTYESSVQVDAQGRAVVETIGESEDGTRWHVRYPGWAFRDADGRLVIDARGQPVEYLERQPWEGDWSPDSMVIGKDGRIDIIDDRHSTSEGTLGTHGPG